MVIYGDEGLKKDHPVVEFLAKEKRCRSLVYYKEGFRSLEERIPFLCTTSVKASSIMRYDPFPWDARRAHFLLN